MPGLPEFRPGDDLAAALATAAPWLADGDVVVVTSKIVSKVEGRLVAAPTDPEARDGLRRELVDAESERVLARRGKTLIVANKLGVVQAAAGVDGSNVRRDELALLPCRPGRQRRPPARGAARTARRRRRRDHHRHDGPLLARGADGRGDRRRRTHGAAPLRRSRGRRGQRAARHRGGAGRRARRRRRSGQGQARRRPGRGGAGCRCRWTTARRPATSSGRSTTTCSPSARRRRWLRAGGRRCCCGAACATSPTPRSTRLRCVGRSLRRYTAPAPHHSTPFRFAWVRREAHGAARRHGGAVARRPGSRRPPGR